MKRERLAAFPQIRLSMRVRPCSRALERHRAGVTRLARSLARRYGVNPGDAAAAASLHDLFKESPDHELRSILRILKVRLDRAALRAPAIWHGPAAEAYARARLGVRNRDVLAAVRWHTTGRSGQGNLERILYVADFCPPDRGFPEAAAARQLARRSLRAASRYVLACKLAYLAESGITPHPASRAMWRELSPRIQ